MGEVSAKLKGFTIDSYITKFEEENVRIIQRQVSLRKEDGIVINLHWYTGPLIHFNNSGMLHHGLKFLEDHESSTERGAFLKATVFFEFTCHLWHA